MTTVSDFALRQLNWLVQRDPWTQNIMRAGGIMLDDLADYIVDIYNSFDFQKLTPDQIRDYETLLGIIPDDSLPLDDRRAGIQTAWNTAAKPSLEGIQNICNSWRGGEILCAYDPLPEGVLSLKFQGQYGIPDNLPALKDMLALAVPAQIAIDYRFRYFLIKEIDGVMTLNDLERLPLSDFAF